MPKFENVKAHYASNLDRYVVEIDGETYMINVDTIADAIEIAQQAHSQN